VTGITGKTGMHFLDWLVKDPNHVRARYEIRVAVRQNSDRSSLAAAGIAIETVVGDLNDPGFVAQACDGVDVVLHIAGIRYSESVLEAGLSRGVPRFVFVHTTGIYSKHKRAASDYLAIEDRIRRKIDGTDTRLTILRPTMIYGTLSDRNVSRFIRLVDRLPVIPVIRQGRYQLQPVHAKDLGKAYYLVLACHHLREDEYVLSGGSMLYMREMLELIADNLSLSRRVLSVPFVVAYAGAWGLFVGTLGHLDFRERVQRMCEDRAYPHDDASRDFGYDPIRFETGLAEECAAYIEARSGQRIAR